MKNLVYTICLFLSVAISQAFATTNVDLFTDNSIQFEEVFSPLDQLTEIVVSNPEADLSFVQVNFASVANGVSLMNQLMSSSRPMEDRPVAGISGYIWGACLGLVGILLVYLLLDDASKEFRKKETTHAVVGCAVSAAVWTVLYVAVFAAAYR